MPDATPSADLEHATDSAQLKLETSTDPMSASLSASLPAKNAADLLPLGALVAYTAGPPAIFLSANAISMPWWVASIFCAAHYVAVTVIVILQRCRPTKR